MNPAGDTRYAMCCFWFWMARNKNVSAAMQQNRFDALA
jgi:hypothetical protein